MSINLGIKGSDQSKGAATQCVKILGQKNPESIMNEGNGVCFHK